MTWSINWDNGKSKAGVAYSWEFKTRYAPLIQGGVTPPPGKPNADGADGLELGATSLKLSWAAATGALTDRQPYTVYRNGNPIGQTAGLSLADSGLTPATQYSYFLPRPTPWAIPLLPSSALAVKTAMTARRPIRARPNGRTTTATKPATS